MEEPDEVLSELDQKLAAHIRIAIEMGRTYWSEKRAHEALINASMGNGSGVADQHMLTMASTALHQPQHERWWRGATGEDIAKAIGLATRFQDELPEAQLVLDLGKEYLRTRFGTSDLGPVTQADVTKVGRNGVAGLAPTLPGEQPPATLPAALDGSAPEETWRVARTETDVALAALDEQERIASNASDASNAGVEEAESQVTAAENNEDIAYDSMMRREAMLSALTPVVGQEAARARVTADHGFSQPATPGDVATTKARSRTSSLHRIQRRQPGRGHTRTRVS